MIATFCGNLMMIDIKIGIIKMIIYRVYYDRLIDNTDQKWFMNAIKRVFIRNFGEDFDQVFKHLDLTGKGAIDENDIR